MGTVLGVAIGSTAAASYSLRMTAEAQQNAAELLKAELVKEKEVRYEAGRERLSLVTVCNKIHKAHLSNI